MGQRVMQLYHFTHPGNWLSIAMDGLEPNVTKGNGRYEYGPDAIPVPAVWLTREQLNIWTAEEVEHYTRVRGHAVGAVGELAYGGTARLTVHLARHDKKLIRFRDALLKCGDYEQAKVLSPTVRNLWWLYHGVIPPHKIEPPSASVMIECLDHNIERCSDAIVGARFRGHRARLAAFPPDTPVALNMIDDALVIAPAEAAP
jgi:hypothetical protein